MKPFIGAGLLSWILLSLAACPPFPEEVCRESSDCGGGRTCDAETLRCVSCTPDCGFMTCGDDGCGGSCGACPGGQICMHGWCAPGCFVDGGYYYEDDASEDSECLVCRPNLTTTAFSKAEQGSPCDQGIACLQDSFCDSDGTCGGGVSSCEEERSCNLATGFCDGAPCDPDTMTWTVDEHTCRIDLPLAEDQYADSFENSAPGLAGNATFQCVNGAWSFIADPGPPQGEATCDELDFEWALWPIPPGTGMTFQVDSNPESALDTVTGLIWKTVSNDGLIWERADQYCSETLNNTDPSGWRLPTIIELRSIIDRSRSPALPPEFPFPVALQYLWSGTSAAGQTGHSWAVSSAGEVSVQNHGMVDASFFCVRSELAGGMFERYEVAAEPDAVIDTRTGLLWKTVVLQPVGGTWDEAVAGCQALNSDGADSGWRLPQVKELESLIDVRAEDGGRMNAIFEHPVAAVDDYWTNDPLAGEESAWKVSFLKATTDVMAKSDPGLVRCVKSVDTAP